MTVNDIIARRYAALPDGSIPPLAAFVDDVLTLADLERDEPDDFPCARCGAEAAALISVGDELWCVRCASTVDTWPASATFRENAWDEAWDAKRAEYDRQQLEDIHREQHAFGCPCRVGGDVVPR